MRVVICGSRNVHDAAAVDEAVRASGFDVTEVVSGGAVGVDRLGELLARRSGIPVRVFPAAWERHGRSAGPIRNREMLTYAAAPDGPGGAVVAVWDGVSRGTANAIETARALGLPVYVHRVPPAAMETDKRP